MSKSSVFYLRAESLGGKKGNSCWKCFKPGLYYKIEEKEMGGRGLRDLIRSSKVLTNVLLSFMLIYTLVFALAQINLYVDDGGV